MIEAGRSLPVATDSPDAANSIMEISYFPSRAYAKQVMPGRIFAFMAGTGSWDPGTSIESINYTYQLVDEHGRYN